MTVLIVVTLTAVLNALLMISGIHVVQPTTALAAAAFCILFFNTVIRRACFMSSAKVSIKKSPNGLNCQEAVFLENIACCISALGRRVSATLPPFIALIARHLSTGQGFSSFYLGIVLWLFMLLGELRILSQIGMVMLAYACLFLLPAAYLDCQQFLDALAATVWKSALIVCARKNRTDLACSIVAGLALGWMLDVGFVVRASTGLLCTCVVLLLRLMPSAAATQPSDPTPHAHISPIESG